MRRTRYWVRRFNLIEIVLAMGVVGIGIAGVMSLMVPALNANKDSAAEAIAAEAASKMIGFLEVQHKQVGLADDANNTTNWPTCIGTFSSTFTVSGSGNNAIYTLVTPANLTKSGTAPDVLFNSSTYNISLQHLNGVTVNSASDGGFFQVLDSDNEAVADVRLFKADQILGVKTGSSLNSDTANIAPSSGIVRYLIEVSWPTNVDYTSASRQFRYFAYEAVKQ